MSNLKNSKYLNTIQSSRSDQQPVNNCDYHQYLQTCSYFKFEISHCAEAKSGPGKKHPGQQRLFAAHEEQRLSGMVWTTDWAMRESDLGDYSSPMVHLHDVSQPSLIYEAPLHNFQVLVDLLQTTVGSFLTRYHRAHLHRREERRVKIEILQPFGCFPQSLPC